MVDIGWTWASIPDPYFPPSSEMYSLIVQVGRCVPMVFPSAPGAGLFPALIFNVVGVCVIYFHPFKHVSRTTSKTISSPSVSLKDLRYLSGGL